MTTLTVWRFDTVDGADAALAKLIELQKQALVEVLDAAVVKWPAGSKKPNTRQLVPTTELGALDGAFWGMLFGFLFFMPIVGAITGGLDFSNYFVGLSHKVTADTLAEAKKQGAVLAWGNFLTIVINFIIVAGVMFGLVNLIQRFRQNEAAAPPPPAAPSRQEVLLTEIRDLLAKRPA